MSIFDRFVSKEAGDQERKPFHPTPYKKACSELEAAGRGAKAQYPDDSKVLDDFVRALKEACRARYERAAGGDARAAKAEAHFFLSEDRMSAYACVLPPEDGGEGLGVEEFLEDMRYEGIQFGVLQEEVERELALGYLRIFPAARGRMPHPGEDGNVTELFQRSKNMSLLVQEGSQVDLSQDIQLLPIRKGAVICLIRAAKPGTDGMDVTGQTIPSPEPVSPVIPQGKNTVIGRGGQALTAGADGILYIKDDCFCVHEQKIIDGDLDQFQGTLQISGNLYIGGNVDGGVEIEASGEIVINGKVGRDRVISMCGTIRVQQGIYGTKGKTSLSAAGQVQSPVIEQAQIEAGTGVIAETISNSSVRCGGTVYALSGRGMILDSTIRAGESILCLRVGNLAGGHSQFSVGYPPHLPESWERLKTELAEVQSTLERLWQFITDLRKKGNRISDGEKSVLDQLVEQRDLYIEKREALKNELKAVNKELDKKSKGRIRCEKLYPSLEVQIGRATETIETAEEACNIRVEESRMLFK